MNKVFKKIRKPVALILTALLFIPANVAAVYADTGAAASKSGFTISASWDDTEFKDGTSYELYEDTDSSNPVKLRIRYENNRVCEEGYEPGEIIITVDGISKVARLGSVEAVVGADKESETNKKRDWSYTWNKTKDTFTFTNNNPIKPNSVVSGYFDMVWDITARDSEHLFEKEGIQAKMLLPDGEVIESEVLSFSNETKGDTYQVDIYNKDMYSYEGLVDGIDNPDEYAFYRFDFGTYFDENSRGLKTYRYVFDPDTKGAGSGVIVIGGDTSVTDLGDGTYKIQMYVDNNSNNRYVFAAYPLSSYGNKKITASIDHLGTHFEGSDDGDTGEYRLAYDEISLTIPADFYFTELPGDVYGFEKDTWYDIYVDDEYTAKKGGDIAGRKLVTGTTETFYLETAFNKPGGSSLYDFEIVDDFIYILGKDGTFRQLGADEYEFTKVTVPGVRYVTSLNGVAVENDKYPVKIYTFKNGEKADIKGKTPFYEGLLKTSSYDVELPSGVTAIAVIIEDVDTSFTEIQIPVDVKFHLDENSNDNLDNGKVVNTTFIRIYKDGQWFNSGFTADNYVDDTELHLADKDVEIYGDHLDREKDDISLFRGDKSEYRAYTNIDEMDGEGKSYTTDVTIGAHFTFNEDEDPDKFSLYTLLSEDLYIDGYDIEEDFWEVSSFSGMGLSGSTLEEHAEVDIIKDYEGSGRTYVAVHFDLQGLDIPQSTSVFVEFPVKVKSSFFKKKISAIDAESVIIMDREIYEFSLGKKADDGSWYSASDIYSDIDRDSDTEEHLSYDTSHTSLVWADSSELQMSKAVKTENMEDFVQLPEVPLAEEGSTYTYELQIRNGASTSEDLVVTDILETGANAKWQGTFRSIDISEAEEKGITGTVWYSDKKSPGEVGGSDWSESMDAEDVKAVAVDFGSSKIAEGDIISIYVDMTAPSGKFLRDQVTENGFSAAFTMRDAQSGNITESTALDSNLVQVKLSAKLKTVIVTKTDATTGEPMKGVDMAIIDVSGDAEKVLYEDTTNEKGLLVFKNVPEDAEYVVRELSAPEGYILAEDTEVELTDDTKISVSVKNERKKGKVQITKTNSLDNLVPVYGAEYGLFLEDGTQLNVAKTNINGVAEFTDIPWGTYYVQETKAPEGYALSDAKRTFNITKNNVDSVQKFSMKDDQSQETMVTLKKYEMTAAGVQTEIPLEGAGFKLYNVTGGRQTLIGTYVTDPDGEIIVDGLVYGDYVFRETRVPGGFLRADDAEFSINATDPEKELIVYDKKEPGTVLMYKKDSAGNAVEGAVFELYDETKMNVLGTYTTDDKGNILIDDLEWGTYHLREKSAPECYVLDEAFHEFSITEDDLNVQITLENMTKKGTVVLTKTNEDGNIFLSGAVFSLFREDGSLVEKGLTTDENGKITVTGLEWGRYYFKETEAPDNYSITDETVRFAVNSMNCSTVQELEVTNPQDEKMIIITKKIRAGDINFDNGDPTFLFKAVGGGDTYYRIMRFDEEYVALNTDNDGYVSQSVTVSGIVPAEYIVTEEESGRYEVDAVTGTDNVTVTGVIAEADLLTDGEDSAEVIFGNDKYEHGYYSDTGSKANVLKAKARLTAIEVEWLGDTEVEARTEIDKSLAKVTAFYDDGTTAEIAADDWVFGSSFTGTTFPNINGEYDIPVSYTENGVTKTDTFNVTIYGAKAEIIRLDASVKEEYAEMLPGSTITEDMFDVTAVYSDGSTRILSSLEGEAITTVTSPDYPDHYPNDVNTYWEVYYPGASSIKVVFDYFKTYNSSDYVYVYDENGNPVSSKLYGTKTGTEIVVNGDYAKITMVTNNSMYNPGFTASVYGLDENGNVLTCNKEYVITPTISPNIEGVFNVNISLAPALFEEDVSTSVNMTAKYADPVLVKGKTFKAAVPSTATSIIFSGDTAPDGVELTDLSEAQDMSVVGWIDGTTWNVSTQRTGVKAIANSDCSNMFKDLKTLVEIDVNYLDTTQVSSMEGVFYNTGYNGAEFNITGLDSWDVSSVTNMYNMFNKAGYNATTWNISDLSNWDTSSVTKISNMFYQAGCNATAWDIGDLSQWDVSSVTIMSNMFYRAGSNATAWDIGDLSQWDVSSVTNMSTMFEAAGYDATTWNIGDLSNWDVSSVTNMNGMFDAAGYKATTWDIGDLSSWDVSSVTNMSYMFRSAGYIATTWNIGDLSNWDTSSVTNMSNVFYQAGLSATTWDIGDLSQWDVSSVTNMSTMFESAGYNATTWNIGDLSSWDVSSVTNMYNMFSYAGSSATTWNIGDLSNWDTSSVTTMYYMFYNAGYSATTWSIGDLSSWNVSSVTSMKNMFNSAGYKATTWNIGNLSNWNVSSVTDMSNMFSKAGLSAATFDIGDLSSWDVSGVTTMYSMFNGAGYNATTWNIGDLSNWDVSSVTDMSSMFNSAGYNATTWSIGDLSNWDVSSVTNMNSMFSNAARYNATSFDIGNIGNWDVSNVTNMSLMFHEAGRYKATTFNIGDLSSWDVSSVTNMSYMFKHAGYSATTFNIGDLSSWDVSSVTNMSYMFNYAGYSANYSLNLSGWDVSSVTSYSNFNLGVESKVTPPAFN